AFAFERAHETVLAKVVRYARHRRVVPSSPPTPVPDAGAYPVLRRRTEKPARNVEARTSGRQRPANHRRRPGPPGRAHEPANPQPDPDRGYRRGHRVAANCASKIENPTEIGREARSRGSAL